VAQTNSSYLNHTCDKEGKSIDNLRGQPVLLLVWWTELLLNRVGTPGRVRKLHKIERTLRLVVLVVYPEPRRWAIANKKGLTGSPIGLFCDELESLNDTSENRIPLADTWPTDQWPTRRHEYAASSYPDDAMESRWWLARGLNARVYTWRANARGFN